MLRFSLLIVSLGLCLNTGCATNPKPLWRAGASRVGFEGVKRPMPKATADVEIFFKEEFGTFEETEAKRYFACSTTTILRKSFLLDDGTPSKPSRDYDALAQVATEEYPRDEEGSTIEESGEFFTIFGIGTVPMDLFEVRLDPAFREQALMRLRYFAAQLGADAVIDVFATGSAEHHMWQGFGLGFDTRETTSFLAIGGNLLGFRLRDVRLHGIAVRYED